MLARPYISRRHLITGATALTAYAALDVPPAKGATVGPFDPAAIGSGLVLKGNNFSIDGTGNASWKSCLAASVLTGDRYMELYLQRGNASFMLFGAGTNAMATASYMASNAFGTGVDLQSTGNDIYYNGAGIASTGWHGWSENNKMALMTSTSANQFYLAKDNAYVGNPTAHTGGYSLQSLSPVRPGVSTYDSIIGINCGEFPFFFTPPSGYNGWVSGLSAYVAGVSYFNPSETASQAALSQSNLRVRGNGGISNQYQLSICNRAVPASSRAYWEVRVDNSMITQSTTHCMGLRRTGFGLDNSAIDTGSSSVGIQFNAISGVVTLNGATLATLPSWYYVGKWVGMLVDTALGKVWFSVDGTWDGDPNTNTGGYSIAAILAQGSVYAAVAVNGNPGPNNVVSGNFGGYSFQGTLPTGASSYDTAGAAVPRRRSGKLLN